VRILNENIILQAEGSFNSIFKFFSWSSVCSCSLSFFSFSSVVGIICCSFVTGGSIGFSCWVFSDSDEDSSRIFSVIVVYLTTGP